MNDGRGTAVRHADAGGTPHPRRASPPLRSCLCVDPRRVTSGVRAESGSAGRWALGRLLGFPVQFCLVTADTRTRRGLARAGRSAVRESAWLPRENRYRARVRCRCPLRGGAGPRGRPPPRGGGHAADRRGTCRYAAGQLANGPARERRGRRRSTWRGSWLSGRCGGGDAAGGGRSGGSWPGARRAGLASAAIAVQLGGQHRTVRATSDAGPPSTSCGGSICANYAAYQPKDHRVTTTTTTYHLRAVTDEIAKDPPRGDREGQRDVVRRRAAREGYPVRRPVQGPGFTASTDLPTVDCGACKRGAAWKGRKGIRRWTAPASKAARA